MAWTRLAFKRVLGVESGFSDLEDNQFNINNEEAIGATLPLLSRYVLMAQLYPQL